MRVKKMLEDIFKPATPEDVESRKDELMKKPMYKYGKDLLRIIKGTFWYPELDFISDITEDGQFYIEAKKEGLTPFAVWLYEDNKIMVLKDVYTTREDVVGEFSVEYPKEKLVDLVLKPIMYAKGIYEDIFKPATEKDISDRKELEVQKYKDEWPIGTRVRNYWGDSGKIIKHGGKDSEGYEGMFVQWGGTPATDSRRDPSGIDFYSWKVWQARADKGDMKRLNRITEDIFIPASPEDVSKRKEEMNAELRKKKEPVYAYANKLADALNKHPGLIAHRERSDDLEVPFVFIHLLKLLPGFPTKTQRIAEIGVLFRDDHTGGISETPGPLWQIWMEKPENRDIELMSRSYYLPVNNPPSLEPIVKEITSYRPSLKEDIFQPASKKDLAQRAYDQWKLGRPFPFLQHIDSVEVLSKGYGSVKGVQYDKEERSELWVKHGVEVNIYYDEDAVADEYLVEIPHLTKIYNESGKTAEEWIKERGGVIEYSGYSGNEDPAYFWGGNFSYVVFLLKNKEFVIMDGKVMEGDFESFWSALSIGDPKPEIASLMGYDDGDYDLMVKDVEKWYESRGEIVKDPPDPNTDPMQMRFPFMDEPPERTD